MFASQRNPVCCPVRNCLIATEGLLNYGEKQTPRSRVVGSCHGEENEIVTLT